MAAKVKKQAQNPLILRAHRLMEAFAKSDDERDFYLDRDEGFIIYVDLDKSQEELSALEKELSLCSERYCQIPKLTFYEIKKIMEGFVNEKVYDIDTKEKLLDIIQSKEAREQFLEFIYDHHSELEKWQQFYAERWRIRIIEWLRRNDFQFVFEEDLDLARKVVEKLKESLFDTKVGKEIAATRKLLIAKAKTYYSSEALNPRPKRGRPPKQAAKLEIEPQVTMDIYTTVPPTVRPFLFTPDITNAAAVTFSSKFESQEEILAHRRQQGLNGADATLLSLNQKLASLRSLSQQWIATEEKQPAKREERVLLNGEDNEDEEEEKTMTTLKKKAPVKRTTAVKKPAVKKPAVKKAAPKKKTAAKKPAAKKPAAKKKLTRVTKG